MRRKKHKKQRSGIALVLAVCMVIILTFLGVGLIRLGLNARMQAVRDVLRISARSAADAGMEHAVQHMVDEWYWAVDKDAWFNTTWYNATPATALGHSFGPVNLGGTYGNASFEYEIYKGTKPEGYQIVSTGTAGSQTRKVQGAVVLMSVFFGIGARKTIDIFPGNELRTIPEGEKIIIQTDYPGEDKVPAINLKPKLKFLGDVIIGLGGVVETGIAFAPNVEIIEPGEAKAASGRIDFPPEWRPSLPMGTAIPAVTQTGWTVPDPCEPTVAYIYGDVQLDGGLTLTKNVIDTLYIEGNPAVNGGRVNVFVYGDTDLSSHTHIIVTEGSFLTLYLGGNLDVSSTSDIVYGDGLHVGDAEIIKAAVAISIIGTTDKDTLIPDCTSIDFQPHGSFYGTIYAPDASLYLAPGDDFYGAIVGGDSVTIRPGGDFVYIPSLVNSNEDETLYMGIKHGSWWE